jgi:hypothetical protein
MVRLSLCLGLAIAACSCGTDEPSVIGSTGTPSPGADAAADATTPPAADAANPLLVLLDSLPISDASPAGQCAGCVRNQCMTALSSCATDPACAQGLLCVVTTCMASEAGAADLVCLLGCFGGDLTVAMKAVSGATCVTTTCGSSCSALIPPEGGADAGATPEAAPDVNVVDATSDAAAD